MEKIDMNMTGVFRDMDDGFGILNEEKKLEEMKRKDRDDWELFLQDNLIKIVPESLLPFIELIGLHYPENTPVYVMKQRYKNNAEFGGWFKVQIPDFALMAFHVNMRAEKTYYVFDPGKFKNIEDGDWSWQELALHKNIKDHRIALALAAKAWEHYLRDQEEKKLSSPLVEPKNEFVYEDCDDFLPKGMFDAYSGTGYQELVQLVRKIIREEI